MFNHLKRKFKIGLSISVLLIISSLIIIFLSIIQVDKLKENVAKHQLEQTHKSVITNIKSFIVSVENNLMLVHGWGKAGLYDNRSAENIYLKLSPILEKSDQIRFISISSSKNSVIVIKKDPDISFSKEFGNMNDTVSIKDQIAELFNQESAPDSIFWSSVRAFHETRGTGISANMKWKSQSDGTEFMVSFGITLQTIAKHISDFKVGENGRVFYFEPGEGKLFQPQNNPLSSGEVCDSTYLKNLDNEISSVENTAMQTWMSLNDDKKSQQFSLKYNKDIWWAIMSPLDNRDYGLWLGILIPEKELLDFMEGRRGILLLSVLLILVLSVFTTVYILQSNLTKNKKTPTLLHDLINEEAILQLITKGESETLEFKSTIRMNLFSGKPGKEIELAWLKGVVAFLNTNGGVIIAGITDSGEIYGLESDNFANKDKCLLHVQNLIKQHIGLEFTRYVNFEIRTLKNKEILIIECLPTNLPVFLKHNDKEQFFIRSGPSSIELSLSKALKYIEDKKDS